MDKKKTIKEMREEIKQMVEASQRRQRTTGGGTALKAPNGKEYAGPGYGEYKPKQQVGQEQVKYKKPERRRPTGREEMIAQRYMDNEDKKKKGGSSVVGS